MRSSAGPAEAAAAAALPTDEVGVEHAVVGVAPPEPAAPLLVLPGLGPDARRVRTSLDAPTLAGGATGSAVLILVLGGQRM